MDLMRDFLVLSPNSGSSSPKVLRSASNKGGSASHLGLQLPITPTMLKRDNLGPNFVNPGFVHDSKSPILHNEASGVDSAHLSPRKVNFVEVLEAVTVSNTASTEFPEHDTPTVRQIEGLSMEVAALRKELVAKDALIESLKVPAAGLVSGSSWKDKVSPPGEALARMALSYFPPEVVGETVRVSPPKHVEVRVLKNGKTV